MSSSLSSSNLQMSKGLLSDITQPGDLHQIYQLDQEPTKFEKIYSITVKYPIGLVQKYLPGFHRFDPLQTIQFLTSRQEKFEEVSTLFSGLSLTRVDLKIPTLEKENNLARVAAYRVFKLFKHTHGPCLLEETALDVYKPHYEKPFPGRFFKEVVEEMTGKKAFAKEHDQCKAIFRTIFAYTKDGKTAHLFSNEVNGMIVDPKDQWVDGDGADPFFQLSGFEVPLSQLKKYKYFLNARQLPCAQLRTMIENKSYHGVYELHVTVSNCSTAEYNLNGKINPLKPTQDYIDYFRSVCQTIGVKPLVISMDKPSKPDQLQTAIYVSCSDGLPEAIKTIKEIATKLLQKNIPTERLRIEAMLHNLESPKTDQEALVAPEGNYFEFHARLVNVPPERFEQFTTLFSKHDLRNVGTHKQGSFKVAYSTVGAGTRYFINAKAHKMGATTALAFWEGLLEKLEAENFAIAKRVKPEYCIYDEKPSYDYQERKDPADEKKQQ